MKIVNQLGRKLKQALRARGFDIVKHKDLPDWLALHEIDIVLDIGANDGRYATEIRDAGWAGKIVSFEPQPAVFERLKQRMTGDSTWSGHQIGLGNENSSLTLNAYGMDVLSSFLQKKIDDQEVTKIQVPVKRPEDILDGVLDGRKRPFVKIDTQGFEMEIIRGFGSRAKDIVGWQIELSVEPLYEGQPMMEEVISIMRANGFSLWRILPGLRDPATLQAFELDGIFFRHQ
ncbi:MAG: FkbM family methyltransferase [Akkermansiaceae bacterium]